MRTLSEDLDAAIAFHGHLCSGTILGVRMARLALRELGISEPLKYRDLIVYVEMDRCLADAISVVTGCTVGRRRLKVVDFGKMAATFVDLGSQKAIRLTASGQRIIPAEVKLVDYWQSIPDEDIFRVSPVWVDVKLEDRPGPSLRSTICARCGEIINDAREVAVNGESLCRACAGQPYYHYQVGPLGGQNSCNSLN